jgi:hypothetical protein
MCVCGRVADGQAGSLPLKKLKPKCQGLRGRKEGIDEHENHKEGEGEGEGEGVEAKESIADKDTGTEYR